MNQVEEIQHLNVVKDAKKFADIRCRALSNSTRFKVNQTTLKEEIVNASVFGELSFAERLLEVLVREKNLTREDIEAELHLAIVSYNNYIKQEIDRGMKLSLDSYLEFKGYHKTEAHPHAPRENV